MAGLQNKLTQSSNLIVACVISDKMKRFNLPNLAVSFEYCYAFSFEYYYGGRE